MHLNREEWADECDHCGFWIPKIHIEHHREFCQTLTKKFIKEYATGQVSYEVLLWKYYEWYLETYLEGAQELT